MDDAVWVPDEEAARATNVARLMSRLGCSGIDELRDFSTTHLERFWDEVVADLEIRFSEMYSTTLDSSDGVEWARWFSDGKINLTSACVDRWRDSEETASVTALIAETEDGTVRELTFAELGDEVDRLTAALRAAGIGPGDAVAVYMPMVAEAVVAAYAIAKAGALYLPVFSGFAAGAIASRLQDAEVRLVLTASGSWRRGKPVELLPALDEALSSCPTVERVVVLERDGLPEPDLAPDSKIGWAEFLDAGAGADGTVAADTAAEDPWMLAYTSGTTGKPKGAVHVHGGFTVKIASEAAYALDVRAGERFQWITDMGWIMGPLTMVGAHSLGAAMVMLEGSPDYPNPDRVWETAARHRVAVLGISPTLIRALKSAGDEWPRAHRLDSLRILGSTGEPWNPEPYRWLSREVGGDRVPIINISGGTEVGACFLAPYPVEPLKACSLGGPCLGMAVDVFDREGRSLRGEVGELVCKAPWPGMTRGVWKDRERYLESYWSTYPGVWRHGDWALVDDDGQWFLFGRSDEAINVAGKRLGPAEVESVLVADPAVAEAATIGVPHETKGEAVWCFWVPVEPGSEDVSERLRESVAAELGRPFAPSRVVMVEALPKTRSAKILRRAVRAIAIGEDPGDLSSAENPQALDSIRAALERD
ncbi:MAG: AMP-binding protein [Actinomycetes bacterium]